MLAAWRKNPKCECDPGRCPMAEGWGVDGMGPTEATQGWREGPPCSCGRTQSHSDTAFPPPADLLAEYCAWLPQAMHAAVEKAWPPTSDL